jgi:hypothetical protein
MYRVVKPKQLKNAPPDVAFGSFATKVERATSLTMSAMPRKRPRFAAQGNVAMGQRATSHLKMKGAVQRARTMNFSHPFNFILPMKSRFPSSAPLWRRMS